jgi:hypothetical protein
MIYSLHVAVGMMLGCFYIKFENHYGVLVHQIGWTSNYAHNLYSGGTQFESWIGHQLSW